MTALLETQKLTKKYQMGEVTVSALDGLDFAVQRGEFVAIMGPSGSGKSTLLHLLGGLDTPTSGEIILAGQAYSRMSDDQITRFRRQKIGFIFQFYNLLPTLTAVENVALPLIIEGEAPSSYTRRVQELMERVDLEDRAGHLPDQLSGGQQQRVAIARAFANQPEIVLADEPTGNLDSRAGTAILELLQATCRELQATIVMVTHDPRAASYADRVVFLRDGQVVHSLENGGDGVAVKMIIEVMESLEL
jgi:putative ABC transport system ATP-binding protein